MQYALADAARQAPAGSKAAVLVRADRVTWPTGALGCASPGRVYADVLTNGYRIQIRSGRALLDYHAGDRNPPLLCPADRAGPPVPNDQIR